jgi:hypothetical protein
MTFAAGILIFSTRERPSGVSKNRTFLIREGSSRGLGNGDRRQAHGRDSRTGSRPSQARAASRMRIIIS